MINAWPVIPTWLAWGKTSIICWVTLNPVKPSEIKEWWTFSLFWTNFLTSCNFCLLCSGIWSHNCSILYSVFAPVNIYCKLQCNAACTYMYKCVQDFTKLFCVVACPLVSLFSCEHFHESWYRCRDSFIVWRSLVPAIRTPYSNNLPDLFLFFFAPLCCTFGTHFSGGDFLWQVRHLGHRAYGLSPVSPPSLILYHTSCHRFLSQLFRFVCGWTSVCKSA